MTEEFDYWIVKGFFKGEVFIPEEKTNFPVKEGTIDLTKYCRLTQRNYGMCEHERLPNFHVKIKTRKGTDHVRNAFDFCEELLTEIVFTLDVYVSLHSLSMRKITPKKGEEENYVLVDYDYDKITGWESFRHLNKRGNLVFFGGRWSFPLLLRSDNIKKIQKNIGLFKDASSFVIEAVDFYKRGIKLENYWVDESFLCFYKVIELFLKEYEKKQNEHIRNRIRKDFYILMRKCNPKICEPDIKQSLKDFLKMEKVLTKKDLFRFICETTKFSKFEQNEEIVLSLPKIRDSVAHAPRQTKKMSEKKREKERSKDPTQDELRICKDLAKHLILIHLSQNP